MTERPPRGAAGRRSPLIIAVVALVVAVLAVALVVIMQLSSGQRDVGGTEPSISIPGPATDDLPPYDGPTRITTPTTISGVTIEGEVVVSAPLTMVDVEVRCRGASACIRVNDGGSLDIRRFRLDGGGDAAAAQGSAGLIGDDITAREGEIRGVENGVAGGSHQLIEDVLVHDLAHVPDGHSDGFQYDGGSVDVTLRRVQVLATERDTSAVMIDNDFGPSSRIVLEDCRLSGGGYTLYLDGKFGPDPLSVSVVGTTFSDAVYGPVLRRGPVTVVEQRDNTADGRPLTF